MKRFIVLLLSLALVFLPASLPGGVMINSYQFASAPPPAGPPITADLVLNLDASDASTLFDSAIGGSATAATGSVARWEDKSGAGNNAILSAPTGAPTRQLTVQNGLDVVRFDASNDGMFGPLTTTVKTVFVVVVVGSPGTFARFFSQSDGGGPDYAGTPYIPLYNAGGSVASYVGASVSSVTLASGAVIYTSTHTGASIVNYRDGSAGTPYSHTLSYGAVQYGIGSVPAFAHSSSEVLGSDVCQVLAYTSFLNSTARAATEAYLKAKWGTP